jgi:hypothetical protein
MQIKIAQLCIEREKLKQDMPGPTKGEVLGGADGSAAAEHAATQFMVGAALPGRPRSGRE